MAKYQHWYIRGWEYEVVERKNGKLTRELVYQGEKYRPYMTERQYRLRRLLFTGLLAAIYAAYLWFSLTGCAGGHEVYAGAGCILAIIPLIFQGMGVVSMWTSGYTMTFREYYASVLRTKVASAFTAGLLGVSGVGQGIFMLLNVRTPGMVWADEWLWLLGCLFCAVASLAIFQTIRSTHYDILPGRVDSRAAKDRPWGLSSMARKK